MEAFQQHVVAELADLMGKIERLHLFFATQTFAGLPSEEQSRLLSQSGFMMGYARVLDERIEAFKTTGL